MPRHSSFAKPEAVFISLILLLLLSGCRSELETRYGQRSGPGASQSVNGTAVLGKMFEKAGHRVHSWHSLSPRLRKQADCIVWFPDDFQPPSKEVIAWLEEWLAEAPGRTLVYVGRDYDAAPFYWQKVLPGAPPEQTPLVQGEWASARTDFSRQRAALGGSASCAWFTVKNLSKSRPVRTLKGETEWTSDVTASRLEMELFSRLAPDDEAEVLLSSRGDPLVSRYDVEGSQLILVANGSFLLNLPLVNREHRKLAGKLIDAVGEPGQKVVFLESRPGGPPIREQDPLAATPTGLEIFQIWPTNWILLHFSVAGVLFCFARWPIFGRPRRPATVAATDFGQHLEAQAALLRRSRDRAYAMSRFLHYKQMIGEGKG
ncbi:MAG: hypothetical protein JXB10_00365 [Pirellulales bacterium]|nr:hypothetical protein [Pirellulales bacterium]